MKAFGIDFYSGTQQDLVEELTALTGQRFNYVVTPNVNHIVLLEHDNNLRQSYRHAFHRLCDSRVLFPLLKRLNTDVTHVIPGSTLTVEMMQTANDNRWAVTVIGCEAQVMQSLKAMLPGITFHHHNPPMGFINKPIEVGRCVTFIRDHVSQLVVFAVGAPRQEILAMKVFQQGGSMGVGLCAGASLLFLSGKVKRAPEWVQRLNLEWFYRICSEPRRLVRRYAVDACRILPIIARQFRNRHLERRRENAPGDQGGSIGPVQGLAGSATRP
jgi:exopolysaccharide biosynthesis WecB/TagA/CpsF family protein